MRDYNYVQPAFPCEVDPDRLEAGNHQTGHAVFAQYGMTLRDYFAAKAMAALVAINYADDDIDDRLPVMRATAAEAYEFADAMLAAREKRP